MKYLILILTFIGTCILQAQQPKSPFDYSELAHSDAWKNALLKEFLWQPVGQMVGKLPSSYAQIIMEGTDLPAKRLNELHEQSERYWTGDLKVQNPLMERSQIDLLTLKDLNLTAVEVWKLLISCNNENADSIRLNLIQMKKFCNEAGSEQEVAKRFFELANNFQYFLISSPLMVSKYNIVFSDNFIKFKSIHPLLVQMATIQWAVFMNHAAEKRDRINIILGDISIYMDSNETIRNFSSYQRDPADFRKYLADISNFGTAIYRLSINSIAFLSFLSPTEENNSTCEIYGIWPAINRALFYKTYLWGMLESNLHEPITRLEANTIQNCGRKVHIIQTTPRMPDPYASAGLEHLNKMKSLHRHWMESKTSPWRSK